MREDIVDPPYVSIIRHLLFDERSLDEIKRTELYELIQDLYQELDSTRDALAEIRRTVQLSFSGSYIRREWLHGRGPKSRLRTNEE